MKKTNSSNPFRSFSLLASAALSPTPACVNAHECSQSTSNQSKKSSPFVSFTLLHSTFVYSSLSSPAFKIVFKFAQLLLLAFVNICQVSRLCMRTGLGASSSRSNSTGALRRELELAALSGSAAPAKLLVLAFSIERLIVP